MKYCLSLLIIVFIFMLLCLFYMLIHLVHSLKNLAVSLGKLSELMNKVDHLMSEVETTKNKYNEISKVGVGSILACFTFLLHIINKR